MSRWMAPWLSRGDRNLRLETHTVRLSLPWHAFPSNWSLGNTTLFPGPVFGVHRNNWAFYDALTTRLRAEELWLREIRIPLLEQDH